MKKSQNQQKNQNQAKLAKQLAIRWIVAIAAMIAAIVTVGVLTSDDAEAAGSQGTYEMEIESGTNTTLWTMTLLEDDTYSLTLEAGSASAEIEKGTYTCEEERVVCTTEAGMETAYLLYEKYLVAEDYLYEGGTISDGKPSGTFSLKNAADGSITFQDDGTFTSTGSSEVSGTWTSDGTYLSFTPDNGESWIRWLIVDQSVANAYYEKTE